MVRSFLLDWGNQKKLSGLVSGILGLDFDIWLLSKTRELEFSTFGGDGFSFRYLFSTMPGLLYSRDPLLNFPGSELLVF